MRIHGGEARGRKLKTREGKGTRPTDARSRETLFNILGARVVGARVLDLYAGTGAIGLEALSQGAQSCLFVEQNAVACRVIRENLRVLGWHTRARVWQNAVKPALRRIAENAQNAESADNAASTNEEAALQIAEAKNDIGEADSDLNENEIKGEAGTFNGDENATPLVLAKRLTQDETRAIHDVRAAHEYSYEAFDIVFADPPFSRPQELVELMAGLDNAGALLHNVDDRFGGLLVVQHHWKASLPLSQRFTLTESRRAGESVLSFLSPKLTK